MTNSGWVAANCLAPVARRSTASQVTDLQSLRQLWRCPVHPCPAGPAPASCLGLWPGGFLTSPQMETPQQPGQPALVSMSLTENKVFSLDKVAFNVLAWFLSSLVPSWGTRWLCPTTPCCHGFIHVGNILLHLLQTEQLQLSQPLLLGSSVPSSWSQPLAGSAPVCPHCSHTGGRASPSAERRDQTCGRCSAYSTWEPGGCFARGRGAGSWSAQCLPGFRAGRDRQGSCLQALPAPACPGREGAGLLASACLGFCRGKELNPAFYCT